MLQRALQIVESNVQAARRVETKQEHQHLKIEVHLQEAFSSSSEEFSDSIHLYRICITGLLAL